MTVASNQTTYRKRLLI